jgi:hypothetical protein
MANGKHEGEFVHRSGERNLLNQTCENDGPPLTTGAQPEQQSPAAAGASQVYGAAKPPALVEASEWNSMVIADALATNLSC